MRSSQRCEIRIAPPRLARRQQEGRRLRVACYNAVTSTPALGTIFAVPSLASERRRSILSMLFWIIAVLSVVGALATVWGLYLLARRWLLFSSEPLGEAKGRNAMHRPWAVASPRKVL